MKKFGMKQDRMAVSVHLNYNMLPKRIRKKVKGAGKISSEDFDFLRTSVPVPTIRKPDGSSKKKIKRP